MLHASDIKDIARLDRRIELRNKVFVDNEYSHSEKDKLVATVWAAIVPKFRMMREEIMMAKETSIQEFHWLIREREDLTKVHYVKYKDQDYDIISIMPVGRDYTRLVTQLKEI